jgi:signal transduction histidine kinase
MAILIGIWESILVLAVIVFLTSLALYWYWQWRLTDLRRTLEKEYQTELSDLRRALDEQHQTELGDLRQAYDRQRQIDIRDIVDDFNRQHETELADLRQVYDRQRQIEIRDMVDDFRHQASHYLRPIKDNLYLLKKEMNMQAIAESLADSLADIEHYEWRLTRLIENMALVSGLEAPDLSFSFSEVKLDVIVSDVVDEFQNLASEKEIRLAWWAIPEKFPRITANEVSLRQVFINLIDNAIKYCGEKDEIDAALEANEDKNVIYARVSDTGPGIPEDDWERIFCKGYTVEEARGRPPKEGGQGLGLYIAKLVVEKHKGEIGVTSKLGKGTTFTIRLPIQRI